MPHPVLIDRDDQPHVQPSSIIRTQSLQMEHLFQRQHPLVRPPPIQRFKKRRHLPLPPLVDLTPRHTTQRRRKIGRFQIPHQQPVVAQKQRVVPPSGFAQRRQHLRPDRLVALFVFREPPRPHLQQKAYTFDHFTSASGIFNSDASLPMRARLWPTPSAQWCVGPSLDQRLLNSTETPEPRLPWYKPSPRSTGRASLMAMWPGPSCPISTKLSRKSIA